MKDISTTLGGALSGVAQGSDSDIYAKVKSSELTIQQKQAIKYFFERLHRVYQAEYRRQLPDESTERACKAEFGDRIMNIPKQVMDKGFDCLHQELSSVKSEYRFMKMDAVIELVKTGGNVQGVQGVQDGAYRVFKPALPGPEEYVSRRKKAAAEGISKLKSLFDE
jgi:hypothetical protein